MKSNWRLFMLNKKTLFIFFLFSLLLFEISADDIKPKILLYDTTTEDNLIVEINTVLFNNIYKEISKNYSLYIYNEITEYKDISLDEYRKEIKPDFIIRIELMGNNIINLKYLNPDLSLGYSESISFNAMSKNILSYQIIYIIKYQINNLKQIKYDDIILNQKFIEMSDNEKLFIAMYYINQLYNNSDYLDYISELYAKVNGIYFIDIEFLRMIYSKNNLDSVLRILSYFADQFSADEITNFVFQENINVILKYVSDSDISLYLRYLAKRLVSIFNTTNDSIDTEYYPDLIKKYTQLQNKIYNYSIGGWLELILKYAYKHGFKQDLLMIFQSINDLAEPDITYDQFYKTLSEL